MSSLKKVAIITGGAQGIGKAIAKELIEKEVIVIIADVDKEAGEETENEYKYLGEIKYVQTDISDENQVRDLTSNIVGTFGSIDILINNAGIFNYKPITELSFEEWNKIIGVNLSGAFLCAKYAAPHLKKRNGSIINIASTRALMSEANTEPYSASKGGIVALTHSLAMSLGPEIRVNCISPGWIDVSEWKKSSIKNKLELTEQDHKQHPTGRVGKPEDVASLVSYLTSDKASFITGSNFVIDGGMTRKMIYAE